LPNQKSKLDLSNFPEVRAWRDKQRKDRLEDAQYFFSWSKAYGPQQRLAKNIKAYLKHMKIKSWKTDPSFVGWVQSDLLYIDAEAAELIHVLLMEEYLFGKHPERYKEDYKIHKHIYADAYEVLDKIR